MRENYKVRVLGFFDRFTIKVHRPRKDAEEMSWWRSGVKWQYYYFLVGILFVGKEAPPVIMKTVANNIRRIDMVCGVMAEAIVFLLMLLVTAEIISRHFFNSPIPGQTEAGALSLVLILYLGLAYGQLQRSHIRVDLILSRAKGRKRELLEALALFLCLIVSALMLWATSKQALISVLGREFISGVISFPVWPGRCAVPFGFALICLTLIMQICDHVMAAFGANGRDQEN